MPAPASRSWARTATQAGNVAVDPGLGNIRVLRFTCGGRSLTPLHSAPWIGEPQDDWPEDLIPIERALAGDFFCAPFGQSDVTPAPAHGWSANSRWSADAVRSPGTLRFTLARDVCGARITKTLRLAETAPLLYQVHEITGGDGGLTVAHHPMIRLAGRGRFSTSPKRAILTPDAPLEPGRNALACGQRAAHLTEVPGSDGSRVDLTDLPIAQAHEDFVTLIEAQVSVLGWSAVLRMPEEDIVFVLKDPRVLPVTMLWHSNGGRDYPPWNGRHRGVLGVEDGCAAGAAGHAASLAPNPVSQMGVPTALPLAAGRTHRIAHVIGCVPRPPGWSCVTKIEVVGPRLLIHGDAGSDPIPLPFDTPFHPEAC
ncbi:MAG: hypothetical protein AAGJ91_19635 [Pseudomonadota bacterium]